MSFYTLDRETGETTWLHQQRAATLSLVAFGGGLVFGGDTAGLPKAFVNCRSNAVMGESPRH